MSILPNQTQSLSGRISHKWNGCQQKTKFKPWGYIWFWQCGYRKFKYNNDSFEVMDGLIFDQDY